MRRGLVHLSACMAWARWYEGLYYYCTWYCRTTSAVVLWYKKNSGYLAFLWGRAGLGG